MTPRGAAEVDEEAFAEALPGPVRLARGAFFTPSEVVERVLELTAPIAAQRAVSGRLQVVDPACGAGAFLSAAARRWPLARLVGVDVEERSLRECGSRVPTARLECGDALTGEALERLLDPSLFTVWLGNPPYNGTSSLLRDKAAWHRAQRWLPADVSLPKGTSLRDDFIFFLLRASQWLEGRAGALAFVTSATLLDAFQHAPVRQALLRRLRLRQVVDLGPGAFRGTRVRTCITVWETPVSANERPTPAHFAGRGALVPEAPDFSLRPVEAQAAALDADWRRRGLPLTTLVPVSFAGLKTRFDELLVDERRDVLLERVRDFVRPGRGFRVDAFIARHGLPDTAAIRTKVTALREVLRGRALRVSNSQARRFFKYRGPLPMGPPAWCYLDRTLIVRGDHRLQGSYDPHAEPVKLVFNVNELPLWATVLTTKGCVTAYRHSRFAPLRVPEAVWRNGSAAARSGGALGPLVPNLAVAALGLAEPEVAFDRIAAFIRSAEVQQVWAPALGTRRILPVPLEVLTGAL